MCSLVSVPVYYLSFLFVVEDVISQVPDSATYRHSSSTCIIMDSLSVALKQTKLVLSYLALGHGVYDSNRKSRIHSLFEGDMKAGLF